MTLLESLNGPFGSLFSPIGFLQSAPEILYYFAKDENLNRFFDSQKESLEFVKAYVDDNPEGAYKGYSYLYAHVHAAMIDSGWLVNPLESGDINVSKPAVEIKPLYNLVLNMVESLLLEYGVQFEEIGRLTPAEARALINARSKAKIEDLRKVDLMNAGVMQAILMAAGSKNLDRNKLLTFEVRTPENEHGYTYGPGNTLVSDTPQTQEELIEQTAHLTEMKRRFRIFTGGKK